MDMRIEKMMVPEDWERVRAIYEQGIGTGNATFESASPDWNEWDSAHLSDPRLVAREGDAVLGWAALGPVSDRCAYAGVAEVSLYVGTEHRGRGAGAALLRVLIEASEREGIWTLQAGVFPENGGSLRLLERAGFRVVGRRERLGKMDFGPHAGRWRDVLLLERRSETVGTD
jgi:L-amino acid N-acyltransferase YncA